MEYSVINPHTWYRKEIFNFFKTFEEPYTGIVTEVNVTYAYNFCKKHHISFFKYYLHKSIVAINKTNAMKLRIVGEEIRLYDKIHASATIARQNGTFGFSHIIYDEDFQKFSNHVNAEIERIQATDKLLPPKHSENVIHYSSLPWFKFTAVSHARKFSFQDSAPKISFGKAFVNNDEMLMNVSVHAHHSLVDGKDIAEFLAHFQQLLDEKHGDVNFI